MENIKATKKEDIKNISTKKEKNMVLHFTKTFSDLAREPFLILNSDLKVVGANASFYRDFRVTKETIDNKLVYNLGNGQWNIPELKKQLEEVLPKNKSFNDFEVTHEFPNIGLRTMLLNAMKLDTTDQILLAIEDITIEKMIRNQLAAYQKAFGESTGDKKTELTSRIDELSSITKMMINRELKMAELKKEIVDLKKNQKKT
jgi:hypothetical protein